MNQCHFLGNLVRDPELTTLNGGKRVVNFSIAVSRTYKKGNGEREKEVSFLDCEAWDSGADAIAAHFKKGQPIIVHASIRQEQWKDKETGNNRSRLRFRVNQFNFVPGSNPNGKPAASQAAAQGENYEEPQGGPDVGETGDADIPF